MSKFTFSLEAILRLRESERDEKQEQLAEAIKAEDILRDQIGQIEEEITELREQSAAGLRPGTINPDKVLQSQRFELLLRAQAKQIQEKVKQVQAEVQRRRDLLVEAERQVKVLEKLREKRQVEFRAKQQKIDRKQIDEIAQRIGQQKS